MSDEKVMYKVCLPGWWFYTDTPPARWRIIAYWIATFVVLFSVPGIPLAIIYGLTQFSGH